MRGRVFDSLLMLMSWGNIFGGLRLVVDDGGNVLDVLLMKGWSNILMLDDDWRYGVLVLMVLRCGLMLVLYLFVRHFVSLKLLLGGRLMLMLMMMVSTVVISSGDGRMTRSVNNSSAGHGQSAGQHGDKLITNQKNNVQHNIKFNSPQQFNTYNLQTYIYIP